MDTRDVADMIVYIQSSNSAPTMSAIFCYNFKIGTAVRHQVIRDNLTFWVSPTLNSAL